MEEKIEEQHEADSVETAEVGIENEVELLEHNVEQAEEHSRSGDYEAAETRLRQVEDRLVGLESLAVDLRQAIEARSPAEHSHPMHSGLQTIADALGEITDEERSPQRKHLLYRRLGRKDE